jgi:hypothetical protein
MATWRMSGGHIDSCMALVKSQGRTCATSAVSGSSAL